MFRSLFAAIAISLCAFSAKAATLDIVVVVPGAPTISGNQFFGVGPVPVPTVAFVNPVSGEINVGFNGEGTISSDLSGTPLTILGLGGNFSVLPSPLLPTFQGLAGTLIDSALSASGDTISQLFSTLPGSAPEFGSLFRVTYTDDFAGLSFISPPLERFDTLVTVEAVTPIPLPAALPMLLAGLGALVMVRRRRAT